MGKNTNKKINSSKSITFTIDKKFIAIAILALAALLIFVGVFGDILTNTIKEDYEIRSTSAINLDYLFRGSWETINRLLDSKSISVGYGYFAKIEVMLCIASFALALIGVSVTILKHVYYFVNKREFSFSKCFSLLSVFSLQYLALVRLIYGGSSKIIQPYYPTQVSTQGLGWGGILITIGFFLGLIATVIYDSREKDRIVSKPYIASKINSAIIFFICVFGITTMLFINSSFSSTYSELYKTTGHSSVFSYFTGLLRDNFFNTNASIVTFILVLISLLLSIASFVIFVLTSYYLFNSENDRLFNKINKYLIVFLVLFVVSNALLITASIVYFNANKSGTSSTTTYGPGYSAYVGLILTVLLIVSVSLTKKWRLDLKTK